MTIAPWVLVLFMSIEAVLLGVCGVRVQDGTAGLVRFLVLMSPWWVLWSVLVAREVSAL